MIKQLFIITLGFLPVKNTTGQTADEYIRKGNDLYRQQKYAEAEKEYITALEKFPGNQTATYNLAATKYRLNKISDAKRDFEKLTDDKNELQKQ